MKWVLAVQSVGDSPAMGGGLPREDAVVRRHKREPHQQTAQADVLHRAMMADVASTQSEAEKKLCAEQPIETGEKEE